MSVQFQNPWVLLLLLLLPAFYVIGWPRLRRMPAWLRRSAMGLRLIIVTLLILALAQPLFGRQSEDISVVFALDESASITPEARAAAQAFVDQAIAQVNEKHRAGLVVFGRDSVVRRSIDGAQVTETSESPDVTGTNLAEVLRLSRSMMPRLGAKRIVLLSDGHENVSRAEDEARLAAINNVQISVVPMAASQRPEVLLEFLDVPPQVREGEPADIRISIQSTVQTSAVLRLWMDRQLISEQSVQLRPGANVFNASQTGLIKGFHEFWARVETATDTFQENNELGSFTVVKDKPRILVIATAEAEGRELSDALTANDMNVDLRPPRFIPPRLSTMKRYDAVVLVNVPSNAMTLDQMKTLQAYVQTLGGGLTVVGGEQAYSLGDYANTPLADVLPVTMNVPGKRDRGSVAIVLIVDKSGSMDMREGNVTKMKMANEAAALAIDSLDPGDHIGVLTFDTLPRWHVPTRQVGGGAADIKQRIQAIEASGGTEIYPALDMGYRAVRDIPVRYRHIILFSDGRSLTTSDYDRLVGQMRTDGVTLSTIAIGSDADQPLLESLARQGEGRYYYVDRAIDVPQVTIREARIASGSPIVEGEVRPFFTSPSPVIRNIAEVSLPVIVGYNVTTPKETAQVVMVPDKDRSDPLLVQWQYGLGRSIAWTSDVKDKWSAAWLTWSEFRRFWSQLVRWTMPAPSEPNLQTIVTTEGNNVVVRVEALDDDGTFRHLQDIRMTAIGTSLRLIEQPVRQVAPGRYETTFVAPDVGVYSIDVAQFDGGMITRTESTGVVIPYPSEYRFLGTDTSLLNRIAGMTSGKVLLGPRAVFSPDGLKFQGDSWVPLWPWLLGAALLLFPIDVAFRRLQVPTEVIARLIGRRRRAPMVSAPG
ncbi:MAG TPA: VWA domain-containing protein [Chloroflexota bacterium]|nr:VWA domain-containing protein [Chloroflexota bacterium]